jgi:hypothetical protein
MKCTHSYQIVDKKTGDEFTKECKNKATMKRNNQPICRACKNRIKKAAAKEHQQLEPMTYMDLVAYVGKKQDDKYMEKVGPHQKKFQNKLMKKYMKKDLGITKWGMPFKMMKEMVNDRKNQVGTNEEDIKK